MFPRFFLTRFFQFFRRKKGVAFRGRCALAVTSSGIVADTFTEIGFVLFNEATTGDVTGTQHPLLFRLFCLSCCSIVASLLTSSNHTPSKYAKGCTVLAFVT